MIVYKYRFIHLNNNNTKKLVPELKNPEAVAILMKKIDEMKAKREEYLSRK